MAKRKVYLLMILTTIFWSGAFITGKLAVQEFPPITLTFFRFLVALPFIFGILISYQPSDWRPSRKQWTPIIVLGILGIFLYHTLFFYSLKYTTSINASLIGATNPMFTTILAVVFLRNSISPKQIFGIICSLLGVFLVVTNGKSELIKTLSFNLGDIIMLLAVISWAIYSVISAKAMKQFNISPLMLTAYTFLVCTLIAAPLSIWEVTTVKVFTTTWGGWLSVLYMAFFSSVLGYLFQTIAIKNVGASRTSIFNNLVPVFTIALSVLILGEKFNLIKLASTGVIILGVYYTIQGTSQGKSLIKEGIRASVNVR